ncbi:zinc finger protein 511-like [Asterias amurensis]|uniref:zinc finger protein 511-like n=1 Tax=Asterias amurensis TaxID=7602 RepID=UPI003AB55590
MEEEMSPCETTEDSTPVRLGYVPRSRRLQPGDAFFEDGNLETSLSYKQMPVHEHYDEEEEDHIRHRDFKCHVMGCNQTFTTVASFEIHYNGSHRNICRYCRRSYPSNHLLDIHISESHDSLFEIMAQKQPMYQCLIESCSDKFVDGLMRKDHMIKHHHYPANFRFQKGICKPRSKPAAKPASSIGEDQMDTEAPAGGATHGDTPLPLSDATYSASSETLTAHPGRGSQTGGRPRVPVNISFGRGGTRSFQRGHQKQKTKPKKGGANQKQSGPALMEDSMDVPPMESNDVMNINESNVEEPMSEYS